MAGLCLLNPWVRSPASLAKTRVKHYYTQRLAQREFWAKLLSGRVAWRALTGLAQNLRMALRTQPEAITIAFQDRMAASWKSFNGPILLLLSGDDHTAKEFLEYARSNTLWAGALEKNALVQQLVPGADHTLAELRFNSVVKRCTLNLLSQSSLHETTEYTP